jgi:hypothetical protein
MRMRLSGRCADEMIDGKWNKFRDDVTHDGRNIDWGKWAITGNDPIFGGTGNPDTGAWVQHAWIRQRCSAGCSRNHGLWRT